MGNVLAWFDNNFMHANSRSIFGDIGKPEDIDIKDCLSQEVPHTKGIFESI